MKKYLQLVFVMIFALVLVGCGGGGESEKDTLKGIKVVGSNEVEVGSTTTYKTEFKPADYANQKVTWSTSDEASLSIDQTGKATANAVKSDGVYVYATSQANDKIRGQKRVYIVEKGGGGSSYPDLGGYNIKIAHAEQALGEYDPFHEGYTQLNKNAKQQAWSEVEKDFNCKITVNAYPSTAEWGPSRWKYIKDQAEQGVSDYDFLTVPDSQISGFVEAGALIDLSDFYTVHGNEMMDPSYITSGSYKGHLYSLVEGTNNIYNVMYYNIGLWETLNKQDPTLKEPAQIFLDGEWNYTKFVNYCLQAQNAMEALYGVQGTANNDAQEYFTVSGWDAYWFIGLSSNDGDPIANIENKTINLDSPHRQAAIDAVKDIYERGFAAKAQNVDQSVTQWTEGKALFNTGDLWFVGNEARWPENMWGKDNTKYGYVPWPMPDDMTLDQYKIGLGGTAQWVMPIGREYESFGPDCNAENIYWAVVEMFQRTKKYYEESAEYDKDEAMKTVAAKYAQSEASQKAYIMIQEMIEAKKGYYDPLVTPDNPVGSLYTNATGAGGPTTIKAAVTHYCAVRDIETWAGAIATLVPILQESLIKAYT